MSTDPGGSPSPVDVAGSSAVRSGSASIDVIRQDRDWWLRGIVNSDKGLKLSRAVIQKQINGTVFRITNGNIGVAIAIEIRNAQLPGFSRSAERR